MLFLRASLLAGLAASVVSGCDDYYLIQDGTCAQACLGSTIGGFCPRALVVKEGKLHSGECSTKGYDVAVGFKDVKAGPCGHINFTTYASNSSSGGGGDGLPLYVKQPYDTAVRGSGGDSGCLQ